jgi:lipopolysaccharide transport system ATP-binding protein
MRETVLTVRNLGKRYYRRPPPRRTTVWASVRRAWRGLVPSDHDAAGFWALRDVTFELAAGERLGIVGRNGAGKSTLLKILARVVYPTAGEARIRGRVVSLLEIGTGFNPDLSGRENVYLNAYLHGLTRDEVDQRFEDIVEFSGVRDFMDLPVRHYSSGMFLRLAFSVAAHLEPDVILLDEVLAVGDLSFQHRCLRRMETLGADGRTVLFVSHSMDAIVRFCTRCIWLDEGRVVMAGSPPDVTQAYFEQALGTRGAASWVGAGPGQAHEADGACPSPRPVSGAEAAAGLGPESPFVRLVAARVVNAQGEPVGIVTTSEAVGIEIVCDVLKPGKNIQPAIHVRTSHDALAFVAAYTDPDYMHGGLPLGTHTTTAWIPPHLLNAGVLSVTVEMATPDPLERHCRVDRAITFRVTEPIDGDPASARGLYGREFPGVVRPRLRWETRTGTPEASGAREAAAVSPETR